MANSSADIVLKFMTDCYADYRLDHILETAYKYFKNPCAIYDVSYKVIGHIGGDSLDDYFWNEIVHNGQASETTLAAFIDDGFLSSQFKILYPCFLPKILLPSRGLGTVRRLCIAIPARDGAHSGWIAVFEHEKPFEDVDSNLLLWFAKILDPLMEGVINNKSNPVGRIENLMLDLLNSSINTVNIEERLRILGWNSLKFNRVLVIESLNHDFPKAMQEYIVSKQNKCCDSIVDFFYNGQFVMVMGSNKSDFAVNTTPLLAEMLERFDLQAGFSAPLNNIVDLRHHYLQAVNCLNVNRIKGYPKRLVFFEDYAIDIMIFMASQNMDVSEFCHPFLFDLQIYDQQQNTEFLDTLRKFVFNTGNLKAAARELHIHRNTLSYRVEKIQELLGVETFNQKLLSDLYISFIIFDIIQLKCK